MNDLLGRLYHKRHPDSEIFDEIKLFVVPRWKESELSGDEWRYGVRVEMYHKGILVKEESYRDMQTAVMYLGSAIHPDTIPDEMIQKEKVACDQVGCKEDAVVKLRLKELYSDRGEKLDPSESSFIYYRKFCKRHSRRGDCGREDSDRNYEEIPNEIIRSN